MAYGLVSAGRGVKDQAIQGMEKVAQNERQREQHNNQMEMAEDNQKSTATATGAGIGASMAMGAEAGMFAGPMGMVYGAALGALAGWASTELF